MVVKTYMRKLAKSGEAAGKLTEYQKILQQIKDTFRVLKHPNVMPTQGLLLEAVYGSMLMNE